MRMRELRVIQPELPQQRAVKFAYGDGLVDDFVAEFVGRAIRESGLESAAGDQGGKRVAWLWLL